MEAGLKSYKFRKDREATWVELDALVAQAEKKGVKSLSAEEMMRLPNLYRATLSSLSVARSISLDLNVVRYLESLCARAYFFIYGARSTLRDAISEFFLVSFPGAVWNARWHMMLSLGLLILGILVGYLLVGQNADWYYSFIPQELAGGRSPTSTTEALRGVIYDSEETAAETLSAFASFLFSHNSMVAMLSFALGFALGIPTILLMFYNGLTIGALTSLYASRGLGWDLWGWLLIHGVTELLAIALCGGAGIILASSLVVPGQYSRLEMLARNGKRAGQIVIGAVAMLFFAALLEGFARQLINDISVRYTIAFLSGAFWLSYFIGLGRKAKYGRQS